LTDNKDCGTLLTLIACTH